MSQDDLPAVLLTRVQQVYAILACVADGPEMSANNGEESHAEETEYAAETETEILHPREEITNEKELISSGIEQGRDKGVSHESSTVH